MRPKKNSLQENRPTARSYLFSLAAVAATLGLRLLADPLMGDRIPYAPFMFPVAWAAAVFGPWPALVTLAAGAVTAAWFIAPPRHSFALQGAEPVARLISFLAIGVLVIVTAETQRRARLRAERESEARRVAEAELRKALATAEEGDRLLQSTLEFLPDGVSIIDAPDARVRMISRYGLELLGAAAKDVIGLSANERRLKANVYYADGKTPVPAEELPTARAVRGELVHNAEFVLERPDGKRVVFLCSASPIRDSNGKVTGGVVAYRDITDRKRFEENLRATAKLESLGILAGGIAHDFNNLLTGVLGNASLLVDETRGSPLAHAVVDAAQQAAKLANQMLAYSGRGKFVVEPIDLSALVRQTARLISASIPKGVALDLALADDLPTVEGDVTQMQQVVMNLVINAAEAIGDREGRVSVTTRAEEIAGGEAELPDGRYVALTVEDNGSGMDHETLGRIFDPFFTTKFTGRGLGLSAVQGIVRGHKGAIRVSTQPGRGSRFVVLLPGTEASRPVPAGSPARMTAGHGLLLVVDDEEMVRTVARRALEQRGYSVLEAADSARAVAILRENRDVSAVLLDMTMPGPGCEDTIRRLRDARPDVPILLSSGFSENEAAARVSEHHLAGFIQKPYTAEMLTRKVAAALGSRAFSSFQ